MSKEQSESKLRETVVADLEPSMRMTGSEEFGVIGTIDSSYICDALVVASQFMGLTLYGDCLKKALFAHSKFGGDIMFGSMRVLSGDGLSAYGFDWNPPHEGHFWLANCGSSHELEIVDLALPGVILRGLKSFDENGPFLVNVTPVMLVGDKPDWVAYKALGKLVIGG